MRQNRLSVRVLSPYSWSNLYTIRKAAPPFFNTGKSGEYGISNIFFPCHFGSTGGALIKQAFTNAAFKNFTAVGRFLNHYRRCRAMDNILGYEFDGTPRSNYQDYNKQNTWHAGSAFRVQDQYRGLWSLCNLPPEHCGA